MASTFQFYTYNGKPLTPLEYAFIQEYMKTKNVPLSVERAGYRSGKCTDELEKLIANTKQDKDLQSADKDQLTNLPQGTNTKDKQDKEKLYAELPSTKNKDEKEKLYAGLRVAGNRLLARDYIREEILHRFEQIEQESIAKPTEILQFYTSVMRGEVLDQFGIEASLDTRIKAANELAKQQIEIPMKLEQKNIQNNIGSIQINFVSRDNSSSDCTT